MYTRRQELSDGPRQILSGDAAGLMYGINRYKYTPYMYSVRFGPFHIIRGGDVCVVGLTKCVCHSLLLKGKTKNSNY